MSDFEHLFSPIRIGRVDIRNRIFQPAHTTGLAEEGVPTERLLRYYEARARGGVGLIIQEAAATSPIADCNSNEPPRACRDEIVPILKAIGEAVHEHGSRIVLQLRHCENFSCTGGSPVAVMNDDTRAIRCFVEASLRAMYAGYDGVEFNFGRGLLLRQFPSISQDIRPDTYGGTLQNHMHFGMQAITAVREAVGNHFVVGLRASTGDVMPEGHSLDDAREFFAAWARSRKLDYLSVNAAGGRAGSCAVPPMMIPPGSMVYLAAEIKQVVDLPVFTAIRINNPVMAEQIIRNNEADMVGMARALICDPDLPRKARDGRPEDIRQCIACNEGCWHRFCRGEAITCVQNPEAGFEDKRSITAAAERKKVLVIGGGCAGMEAAVVAHQRGHEAILCEKTGELGGAIRTMAMAPNRQEFGQAVRFLKHELERLRIEVRTHTEITAEGVLLENPDVVVVATGGVAIDDPSPKNVGGDFAISIAVGTHIVTAEDVLRNRAECGRRVVIADCQRYLKGLLAAELLVDQGKVVTVVMPAPHFNPNPYDVELITLGIQLQNLTSKGVTLLRDHRVKRAIPGKVIIRNVFTQNEQQLEADSVVLSYWRRANDSLYTALKGRIRHVYRIGDALEPRLLMDAIHEGYRIATQI